MTATRRSAVTTAARPDRWLHRFAATGILIALTLAACSGAAATARPPATPTQVAAGGDGTGGTSGASADAFCNVFTTDEVAKLAGAPVGLADEALAFGSPSTGCLWVTVENSHSVTIQIEHPASTYDGIASQLGNHPLQGLGDRAVVGTPLIGGTEAAAVVGDAVYVVRTDSTATTDQVAAFLRDFVSRYHA